MRALASILRAAANRDQIIFILLIVTEFRMLPRPLKTISFLFTATIVIGAFLTLPSLGMDDNQEKEHSFHPFILPPDDTDIIIRGNPKTFAVASREYYAYVCKQGFIIYCPESYQLTKEEELSQLTSLMNDNRQISIDYILTCPPVGVSDYHTDVIISLLDKSEIPIRELELGHTFNTHIAGTECFHLFDVGPLCKETLFQMNARVLKTMPIMRTALCYKKEEQKSIFENQEEYESAIAKEGEYESFFNEKLLGMYPITRTKHIKSEVLGKMISLLDSIAKNDTVKTLNIRCDGLDLIEDELLEALGKNSTLTSLSINPTHFSSHWGLAPLTEYLSTNKTLKNLTLENVDLRKLNPRQFEGLAKLSILKSLSIDAQMSLSPQHMEMIQNYLLNNNTCQMMTIKNFHQNQEGARNFVTSCTNACMIKNINLEFIDDEKNNI